MTTEMLLRKRIYQVEPPPETIDGWQQKQDKEYLVWGQYFATRAEFEYFVMLPLTDTQRLQILEVLKTEKRFTEELRACKGQLDSDKHHRSRCVKCCVKARPWCAAPYF